MYPAGAQRRTATVPGVHPAPVLSPRHRDPAQLVLHRRFDTCGFTQVVLYMSFCTGGFAFLGGETVWETVSMWFYTGGFAHMVSHW